MDFTQFLKENSKFKKIVYPEPYDERILKAVRYLKDNNFIEPILVGDIEEISKIAERINIKYDDFKIIKPEVRKEFVKLIYDNRKGKITYEDAKMISLEHNYFSICLLKNEECDGLVCGASIPSKDTFKPALQIVKTNNKRASTFFIIIIDNKTYLFTDCALNVNPTASELASIALNAVEASEYFNIKPRIALLSFSTKGSANHSETRKVMEAYNILKERNPYVKVEGEVQVDAALNNEVAVKKGSKPLEANILVFPDLNSGNIGYKLVSIFGNAKAYGPINWGFNKPISDLSRSCSVEDIIYTSLITSMQVKE